MWFKSLSLTFLLQLSFLYAYENGVGLTPAMGWNTWNKYGCNIDEDLIKQMIGSMTNAPYNLRDLGYSHFNLDDCWMAKKRNPDTGELVADPKRFPSGMKALGDFLHEQGFSFGIYSSAGIKTCEGLPASLGKETIDANTFSSWGVDYLKYDNCWNNYETPEKRYPVMSDALNATGRSILYSVCEWGNDNPAVWIPEIGNSWRTTPDIVDNWDSVLSILAVNARRWRYAGPGGFNDPDMLEVGNGGMSIEEYKSHFSLWSIMKSPLILGNDLHNMTQDIADIITNKDMIALNQDPLAVQARRVWSKPSENVALDNNNQNIILTQCPSQMRDIIAKETSYPNAIQDAFQWHYDADTSLLKSHVSQQCLVANMADKKYQVITAPCDPNNENQQWVLDGHDSFLIKQKNSNNCVSVVWDGNSRFQASSKVYDLGITLEMTSCQSKDAQTFSFDAAEKTSSMTSGILVNKQQNQCMFPDRDAYEDGNQEIWYGPLANNEAVVLFFNKMDTKEQITLNYELAKVNIPILFQEADTTWKTKELWSKKEAVFDSETPISVEVASHGVAVFRMSKN